MANLCKLNNEIDKLKFISKKRSRDKQKNLLKAI